MESTSATTSYHRVTVDGVGIFYRKAGPNNAPRPFDVAEAAFASHVNGRSKAARVPDGVVRGG